MNKITYLDSDVGYKLLDEKQQDICLREKLADLYSTPFADILWWELRDPSIVNNRFYKMFYYEQNILKHIILFKYFDKTPGKIFVLNKEFNISLSHIDSICHILYKEFDKVTQIIFEKILNPSPKQSPKMVFEKTSNDVIILDLPKSTDAFIKSLGMSTRKHIKRCLNGISRDFPDYKIYYFENSNIEYGQIYKIASLNRDRMKTKGIKSALNDVECKRLHHYATSGFGFLCVCEIDGKIIGGTINSIFGEHAYMHVISHDNSYHKYSIGNIVLIKAIQYLIEEKKINYYHLLSGTQEYKFRFGGIDHDLYTIRIFRNKNISHFLGKTMGTFRNNYGKFKKKLKGNKIIHGLYIKLNKMKINS